MSWESSALYYSLINELVAEKLGVLADRARGVEAAGADFVVLCTNTMHKVADQIEAATSIPLLHLGHVTAEAVLTAGVLTVELLGTRFTMEEGFYIDRFRCHGLTVVVPAAQLCVLVNRVIFGCTEIESLITQWDTGLLLFPTTRIHAEAAVARALGLN